MSIDDRMLMDLANQLGIGRKNPKRTSEMLSETKDNYEGKSEEQLLQEILKLKQVLKKDRKAFDKQMEMIKSLKPMMTPEQRKKLERLLKLLDE